MTGQEKGDQTVKPRIENLKNSGLGGVATEKTLTGNSQGASYINRWALLLTQDI